MKQAYITIKGQNYQMPTWQQLLRKLAGT